MRTLSTTNKLRSFIETLYNNMTVIERLIMAVLLLLLVTSGIWSIVGYINRHTTLIPQSGGIYREGVWGQPRYLSPILSNVNAPDTDIVNIIYSPLFKLDSNLTLQNDLATTYKISEDKKEYTIKLRPDVVWHDGEKFTANDVVFTIHNIQNPEYNSPLGKIFEGVIVEKIDDYTVVFKLSQPYAPFLNKLTIGIVPEHVWKNIIPSNAGLAEQMLKPIGTGPYQFSEIKIRRKTGDITELKLIRNKKYYGKYPHLDGITFTFFSDQQNTVQALLAGKVDGISTLPLDNLKKVEKHKTLKIYNLKLPQYFGLFFNQQQNKFLADAGVRNALALGTDRKSIVEKALNNRGESLHLPIPPGLSAYNEELEPPTYNPEAAKQNLEEAGWKDTDNDGIREKDDSQLHFKIITTNWPQYVKTAEEIQRQWKQIGVDVEIEYLDTTTIQQAVIQPRNYEILLFGEILSIGLDPYPLWHSTQIKSPGLNFSMFSNEDVDKILEEARKTFDENKRQELFKEFQGIILNAKPALILYRPYYLFSVKNNVHGITNGFTENAAGRFNNIEEWYIKVKRIWK